MLVNYFFNKSEIELYGSVGKACDFVLVVIPAYVIPLRS